MSKNYRIETNDFHLSGSAVTYAQQFTARIYAPVADVVADPGCLDKVANRIRVGDKIEMHYTDDGKKAETLKEMAQFLVFGFDGKHPVIREIIKFDFTIDPDLTAEPSSRSAPAEGDALRSSLAIVEEKTGQGRGKPALITYLVKDGLGNVLNQFKDREGAEGFVDAYQSEAA